LLRKNVEKKKEIENVDATRENGDVKKEKNGQDKVSALLHIIQNKIKGITDDSVEMLSKVCREVKDKTSTMDVFQAIT
jgi:hypothetical protein